MQQRILNLGTAHTCWLVESLGGGILCLTSKPGLYPCASVNLCMGGRVVMNSLFSPSPSCTSARRELWVLRVSRSQTPCCRPAWLFPGPWLQGLNPHIDLSEVLWNTSIETPLLKGTLEKTGFSSFQTQAGFNHSIMLCHDSFLVKPENPDLRIQ